MTMLKELFTELVGMFVGDAHLTIAILGIVSLSAILIDVVCLEPLIGGAVILTGCLVVLFENVRRSSRRRAAK